MKAELQTCAILLFAAFAVLDQWTFRCQRVARGILLLARDSAAAHSEVFSAILPQMYVNLVWLKRVVWLACALAAWRSWGWWTIIVLALYGPVLGSIVDIVSPWPSYRALLAQIRARIESFKAGGVAFTLLPTIRYIDSQLHEGGSFEAITTGKWLSRAADAARRAHSSTRVDEDVD